MVRGAGSDGVGGCQAAGVWNFRRASRWYWLSFSMGGLICRCDPQQLGGNLRQEPITLSTPHNGTYSSYLFNRPATIQMRPGSQFLSELNRYFDLLDNISFTSIWTPHYITIMPSESSRLPVGRMLQIPTLIHHFVVERSTGVERGEGRVAAVGRWGGGVMGRWGRGDRAMFSLPPTTLSPHFPQESLNSERLASLHAK